MQALKLLYKHKRQTFLSTHGKHRVVYIAYNATNILDATPQNAPNIERVPKREEIV